MDPSKKKTVFQSILPTVDEKRASIGEVGGWAASVSPERMPARLVPQAIGRITELVQSPGVRALIAMKHQAAPMRFADGAVSLVYVEDAQGARLVIALGDQDELRLHLSGDFVLGLATRSGQLSDEMIGAVRSANIFKPALLDLWSAPVESETESDDETDPAEPPANA